MSLAPRTDILTSLTLGYSLYGYAFEEHPVASPCESPSDTTYTTSPIYDTQAEVGYFNGHVVPLGLVSDESNLVRYYNVVAETLSRYLTNDIFGQDEHLLTSLTPPPETYETLAPPHAAPLDAPTQHPAFQFTRSYTLAEAITPIERQHTRQIRPSKKLSRG